MIRLKSIKVPRNLLLDPQRIRRAVDNALNGAAKAAKVDLDVTTQTWKSRPTFTIEERPGERIVSTEDKIFGFVDSGTPPHIIEAKPGKVLTFGTPHRAKTRPRVIGSTQGSRGSVIVRAKRVNHPGTEPRHFSDEVAKKWQKQLPVTMQRAIDAEAS